MTVHKATGPHCAEDAEDMEAGEPVETALQLPQQLDLPEAVRAGLKEQWDMLQSTIEQLRPIERFRVVGVAFRRCFILSWKACPYAQPYWGHRLSGQCAMLIALKGMLHMLSACTDAQQIQGLAL